MEAQRGVAAETAQGLAAPAAEEAVGVVLDQAEVARLWVPRLWFWGDTADLDESEAKVKQSIDRLCLLVESSCKTDRVGEFPAEQFRF